MHELALPRIGIETLGDEEQRGVQQQGESAVGLLSQTPAANNDMRATKDDFLYLDPAAFPADYDLAKGRNGRRDRKSRSNKPELLVQV